MIGQDNLVAATPARFTPARMLVALVAAGWLLLAAPWPASLEGTGIAVVLALLILDILLGITTGWVAFIRSSRLDERQMLLRDKAYRIAFRLIAVGILVMFGLVIAGGILAGPDAGLGQYAAQLPDGFSGRVIAALLESLVILPTAVIAWLQPADTDLGTISGTHWLRFIAVPLMALAWLVVMWWGPVQLLTRVGSNGDFSEANATCQHYAAQRRVGLGFGAAIRVGAEVCWNGRQAFVVGDPSLTPAGATLPQEATPYFADLFSCAPYPTDVDFATASEQCVERIDGNGTMTLTTTGVVSPIPGGGVARRLQIQLVVDRKGQVLRFQ